MSVDELDIELDMPAPDADKLKWLQERKTCIGGTDISAIMGTNPWKSALAVYDEKTRGDVSLVDNERMLWGRLDEDVIAAEVERRLHVRLYRANGLIRHPDKPHHAATIDRRIIHKTKRKMGARPWKQKGWENIGCEIKTAGVDQRSAWMHYGPPPYYVDQCLWYLHCTGWDAWVLAARFGGNELKFWYVTPDAERISLMSDAADLFWDEMQRGNPPPPSGMKCDTDIISRYFPHCRELTQVEYTAEFGACVSAYNIASEEIKRLEAIKEKNKQEMFLHLGEAESCALPEGGMVTWKPDVNGKRRLNVPKTKTE